MKKRTGWPLLAVALAAALQVACAGSLVKNAYNGLSGVRAAYLIEEEARAAFCAGKAPQPPPCVKGLEIAEHAYKLLKDGATLVATYAETKAAPLKERVISLIDEAVAVALDLNEVLEEFR